MVSRERVKIKGSYGLTWLKSKGVRQCQRALHSFRTQIIISSTLHHLSKSDFRHHLILPVLFHSHPWICVFTPLLSLSSSRFISIFDRMLHSKRPHQVSRDSESLSESPKKTRQTSLKTSHAWCPYSCYPFKLWACKHPASFLRNQLGPFRQF